MNCQRLRILYDDYRDGCLPEALRRAIGGHLDRCGPCREFFRFQEDLKLALSGLPAFPAPADFENRLKERLRVRNSQIVPFRPKSIRPLIWIAASLFLAIGLLLVVWRTSSPIRTSEPGRPMLADAGLKPEADILLPVEMTGQPKTIRFLSKDNQSGRDIMVEMPAAYTVHDFQQMEAHYLQEVSH